MYCKFRKKFQIKKKSFFRANSWPLSKANDWVIEQAPGSDKKYVKRMTTFEGAMNTDVNFQHIMDQKQGEPDKPPSADVLTIRWTCENILEEVC